MSWNFVAFLVLVSANFSNQHVYLISFPPKAETAEKLSRMYQNIVSFEDTTLDSLERDYATSQTTSEIRDMLQAARQKYAHFESRNRR